jgi:hypothetical protein
VLGLRSIEEDPDLAPVPGWVCPSDWLRRGHDPDGDVHRLDVRAAERSLSRPVERVTE